MLAPEDVWVPDVVVYSLIDSKQPGIESITVNADGSTRWLSQKVITVGCSFLLDAFPFDTQTCNFTLGSYVDLANEVLLKWYPGREAFGAWDQSCPGAWVPSGVSWQDVLSAYPSGSHVGCSCIGVLNDGC